MRFRAILPALVVMLTLAACDQTQIPMEPLETAGPAAAPISFTMLGPADAVNVAAGATVSLTGVFFTGGWGSGLVVSPSTVVDGVFFPRGTQWDQGPVWWDARDGEPRYVTVALDGTYRIYAFIAQVDDNDAYILSYWNGGWTTAWLVPNYNALGWGMQTRPNPDDDTERYVLPTPIVADALRLELDLTSTDRLGSVSELQAFGVRILDVDIKPGSFPNSINRRSKGVVPVAILGSADFDVGVVNVSTLEFGPGNAAPAHDLMGGAYFGHLQDVNSDGYIDLVSHYRQREAGFTGGEVEACLTGETTGGIPFEGCDSVRIL